MKVKKLLKKMLVLCALIIVLTMLVSCATPSFELKFEVDGEIVYTIITDGQKSVKLPDAPKKDGYIFKGWYWDKDVWEKPLTANSLLNAPLSEDMKVYAKWGKAPTSITVRFDSNGGSNVESIIIQEGGTINLPAAPTKNGYVFDGWYSDAAFTPNGKVTASTTFDTDTLLFAKWLAHTHDYILTTVDATCEKEGYTLHTCICGHAYKDNIKSILGHEFEITFTEDLAPTCTADGRQSKHCTRCKEKREITAIPSLGHTYVDEICSVCEAGQFQELSFMLIKSEYAVSGLGTVNDNNIIIPAKYKGKPVTSIGNSAFYNCKSLISVTFAEESQLISIGESAFRGCSSLTSITLPNGVTNIRSSAFYDCTNLAIINIPSSVTNIGASAFYDCSSLTSIAIPTSVTSIGNGAFYNCNRIIISVGVAKAPNGWHSDWKAKNRPIIWNYNHNDKDKDGYSYITEESIIYRIKNGEATAYTSPTSITTANIKEAVIYKGTPYTLTSIGESAFSGCSSLTSITIPFVGASKDGTSNTHFGYIFGASSYTSNSKYVPTSLKTVIITGGTSISASAFRGCSSLTSITLPNSITNFGDSAFSSCSSLTNITIPSSVTSIGNSAFSSCSSLTSVTIPSSVTSIGNSAFSSCSSLTSITVESGNRVYHSNGNCLIKTASKTLIQGCNNSIIPTDGSVTSIGSSAFDGCSSLTSITIPDSVTSIGNSAFFVCSSLVQITIPNSVTCIGNSAFKGSSSLTSVTFAEGSQLASIGNSAFSTCSSLTNITIPSSVTSIGDAAFGGCSSLTSITIPSSVTSIGDSAFFNCNSLASVTLPSSITSIGDSAFYGCRSLVEITIPNSVTSIGSYAFSTCSNLVEVYMQTSVTSIGSNAFSNCSSLIEISIPSSVTSIGSNAFANSGIWNNAKNSEIVYADKWAIGYKGNTGAVTSLILESETVGISTSAFSSFSSLISVSIPNSVTNISDSAFKGCSSLTSVTFAEGSQLASIGNSAFSNCRSLTNITLPSSVTSIGDSSFSSCSSLVEITIPNSVTSIGNSAFLGCSNLTSVTFAEGSQLASIGNSAFYDCYSLTSITLPSSLTSIDDSAFYGCRSLVEIAIPTSVTSIGISAFYGCNSLTTITIPFVGATKDGSSNTHFGYIFGASSYFNNSRYVPTSLKTVNITGGTSIGAFAFSNCSSLTSVILPSSITSIGDSAFSGCSSLTSVALSNYVTKIGYAAFSNCSSLASVTIPNSVTSIGDSAFSSCSSLVEITIPNSVTSIGNAAFIECGGLTSITISSSLISIGISVFQGCRSLTSITLAEESQLKSIGSKAFSECSSLISVTIPNSVTSIGDSAFSNCSSLTIYAEALSQPSGWRSDWNSSNRPVIWNYKP